MRATGRRSQVANTNASTSATTSATASATAPGIYSAGALGKLRQAHGLAALPLAAMGASSGGAFVLQLPQLVPGMRAVVSQIMAIPPQMLISQEPQLQPQP